MGLVFSHLADNYRRMVAGLERASPELSTLPSAVADELRRLQRIVNGAHDTIGFGDAGKYYANSDLGAVGKRGWQAVLRHIKPLPFPSVDSEPVRAELFCTQDLARISHHMTRPGTERGAGDWSLEKSSAYARR